jgi:hippurate hydrolase
MSAGLPEDRMPIVEIEESEFTPATYNNPELTQRWVKALRGWFGKEKVVEQQPAMGAEDFGLYGRTPEKIPICMLWLGSVPPAKMKAGSVPSIHSPFYYPDPEPTLKMGVETFAAAVMDLLARK